MEEIGIEVHGGRDLYVLPFERFGVFLVIQLVSGLD